MRYDSHGGDKPQERVPRMIMCDGEKICGINPILLGKKHHGLMGNIKNGVSHGVLADSFWRQDGGWPGGLYLVEDYATRIPYGIRPLIEWFGYKRVYVWVQAFLWHAFGWKKVKT